MVLNIKFPGFSQGINTNPDSKVPFYDQPGCILDLFYALKESSYAEVGCCSHGICSWPICKGLGENLSQLVQDIKPTSEIRLHIVYRLILF